VRPQDPAVVLSNAVRANVRASTDHLRHGSRILEELVLSGHLRVVGAEYELETGAVEFFDGV
jgi:carbonic anhydrase